MKMNKVIIPLTVLDELSQSALEDLLKVQGINVTEHYNIELFPVPSSRYGWYRLYSQNTEARIDLVAKKKREYLRYKNAQLELAKC